MTIFESLKAISLYPISESVISEICESRGVDPSIINTIEIRNSDSYKLVKADIYKWLCFAPTSINEGGVSISISDKDKLNYMVLANRIYQEIDKNNIKSNYGYKGDKL